MRTLPSSLATRLHQLLESVPKEGLRKASADLTHRYKQGQFIQAPLHRYAYLAARLPATYGVACQVLSQIEESKRSECRTLLDLGAGAGSLAWAASEAFPHLTEITLIEQDKELIQLGHHLNHSLQPTLTWKAQDIAQKAFSPHDVIVLSYVLNELSETQQARVVKQAYQKTGQFLILIEPGTPEGFGRILRLRDMLLEGGAHMVAPCPQGKSCPLAPAFAERKDWCHFSVRLARESFHQTIKEGKLSYEDEKYMYLIVSPSPSLLPQARIIKAPRQRTGHVILDLCTDRGEEVREVISKKDALLYTKAKDSKWGDPWDK